MRSSRHGADLYDLEKKYRWRPEEILDFSSNINPLGPPDDAMDAVKYNMTAVRQYPDPDYRRLKSAIAEYTHTQRDAIALGVGTTQLIQDYIHYIKPKRALINSPCYSEYARELKRVDAQILEVGLDATTSFQIDVDDVISRIQDHHIDLYIMTNPNNPTGSILKADDICRIADETGVHMLVDETYVEFCDLNTYSATTVAAKRKNLFVLRGTSKFFATPGLRLGYGISGDSDLIAHLTEGLPLWSINSFADMMGQVMFKDTGFRQRTLNLMAREKEKIIAAFNAIDALKLFDCHSNFFLAKIEDTINSADQLKDYLLRRKIVIRNCADFKHLDKNYFRFCVLDAKSNDALIKEITHFFK